MIKVPVSSNYLPIEINPKNIVNERDNFFSHTQGKKTEGKKQFKLQKEYPNRTNDRTLERVYETFPTFKEHIVHFIDQKLEQGNHIGIIDIGTGKGHILEELKSKNIDKIYANGIGKYPEREQNPGYEKGTLQAKYHQIEIIDKLPEQIQDNSVDIVYSLYSTQYIPKIFHLLESIHQKLRPGGKAYINIGQTTAINPKLLQQFLDNNFGNQIQIHHNHIGQRSIVIEKTLQNKLIIPEYQSKLGEYIINPNIIKSNLSKYIDSSKEELLDNLIEESIKKKTINTNLRKYAYIYHQ